jgi:hypothetical protein
MLFVVVRIVQIIDMFGKYIIIVIPRGVTADCFHISRQTHCMEFWECENRMRTHSSLMTVIVASDVCILFIPCLMISCEVCIYKNHVHRDEMFDKIHETTTLSSSNKYYNNNNSNKD